MSNFQKRWIEGKTVESVVATTGCENNVQALFTSLYAIVFTDGSRIDLVVVHTEDEPAVAATYHKASKDGR